MVQSCFIFFLISLVMPSLFWLIPLITSLIYSFVSASTIFSLSSNILSWSSNSSVDLFICKLYSSLKACSLAFDLFIFSSFSSLTYFKFILFLHFLRFVFSLAFRLLLHCVFQYQLHLLPNLLFLLYVL